MNAFSCRAVRAVLLFTFAMAAANCGGQPPPAPAPPAKTLGLAPQGCEAGTFTVSSTGQGTFVVVCDPARTGVPNEDWCPNACSFSLSAASDAALERGVYELQEDCRRINATSVVCSLKTEDAARIMSRSFIKTQNAYVKAVEVRSNSSDGRTGKPFKFDDRSNSTFTMLVNKEIAKARGESSPPPVPAETSATRTTAPDSSSPRQSDAEVLSQVEADVVRLERSPQPWGDAEKQLDKSCWRRLKALVDGGTSNRAALDEIERLVRRLGRAEAGGAVSPPPQQRQAPAITPEQARRDAEAVRRLPAICIECCHAKMPAATREHCQVACRTVTVHQFAASEAMMPELEGTIFGSAPAATRWDTTHAFYNTLDRQLKCQ